MTGMIKKEVEMEKIIHVGIDVGSTTVKIVVMNQDSEIIYKTYRRHFSDTKNTVCKCLEELIDNFEDYEMTIDRKSVV